MEDSDILGGQLLVAQHGAAKSSSVLAFTGLLYYSVMTILLGLAAYFLHPYYIQLRDRQYRKNLRRRHGIPDNDRRPFNLAFAAAKRVHFKPIVVDDDTPDDNVPLSRSQSTALQRHVSRQRQNVSILSNAYPTAHDGSVIPLKGSSRADSRRTSDNTITASESDYPSGGSQQRPAAGLTFLQSTKTNYSGTASGRNQVESGLHATRSKHAREHDDELEKESKKTRVEGDELIDGDEEAGWHGTDMDVDMNEVLPALVSRRVKRMATDEDEGFESSGARDKRTRKSVHDNEHASHVSSAAAGGRSKKRDRTEASGLGDSGVPVDDEDEGRQRRRRRRVVSTSTKAGSTHGNGGGRKRGREVVSGDSDDDRSESPSKRAATNKRGRRVTQGSDSAEEDDTAGHMDAQRKGRRIGDEWQAGNVRYRIGLNGQRERCAVVKRRRPCFDMPHDSTHPDRNIEIDVFVEAWLTDEEYKAAKARQELGFPSQASQVSGLDSPSESTSQGKRLLYSSVAFKDAASSRHPPSAQALIPAVRVKGTNGALVRTASAQSSSGPGALENASTRVTRAPVSLWEKQKREAKALSHLVVETNTTVKPSQDKPKLIAAPTSAAISNENKPLQAPAAASSTPTVTSASVPPSNSLSFAKPATSANVAGGPTKPSDLPSLTIPSAPVKPAEPTQPSTVPFASLSAASGQPKPAAPAAPTPAFFVKPAESKPAETASSSKPSSSNAVPNFFAMPSAPAPSSASVAPPSLFAAPPAQKSVPASSDAPKNAFTFGPSAPPAPTAAPAQSGNSEASKSAFSFGPSASSVPASAKTDAQPSAAPAAAPSLMSRLGGFGAPSQPPASAPAQVPSFGTPAAPPPSSNAPGQPTFNFGASSRPAPPAAAAPAPTSLPASSGSQPFSFGTNSAAAATAPSSFGTSTSAAPVAAAPPAASAAAAFGASKPPQFTFGPSSTPAAASTPAATDPFKPQSAFSFGTSAPSASSQAATTGPSSNTAPKFTFGDLGAGSSKPMTFGATPAAQQASSGTAAPAASTFGVPSQNMNGTTGSAFGGATSVPSAFAAPSTAASGPGSATQSGNATKPTFTFGSGGTFATPATPSANTTSSNVFGASTTPAGTPGPSSMFAPQTPIPAPSFGVSTTPAGKPPMFGSNGANGASAFGGQGMATPVQPKDASKPIFSFGTAAGSTTPAGPPPSKDASKPIFSFGAAAGSTTPAGPPPSSQPKFSFGFGNSAPAANTNGTNTTPAFGLNQQSPSAFGFGSAPAFTFGNPANSNATQK